MSHPQRVTTVRTERIGDGLGVHDVESGKTHILNATTALVWQCCDGRTTSEQMVDQLQRTFDLRRLQAEGVLSLALEELRKADLLEAGEAPAGHSRRDLLRTLATAGLSLVLIPLVTAAKASASGSSSGHHHDCGSGSGSGDGHDDDGHDDDGHDDDGHDHDHEHDDDHGGHSTTTSCPRTTTSCPRTTTSCPRTTTYCPRTTTAGPTTTPAPTTTLQPPPA